VYLTVNGEECASAFCDHPKDFDVVLMDMQVSSSVIPSQSPTHTFADADRRWSHLDKDDTLVREDAHKHILCARSNERPRPHHRRFRILARKVASGLH
jgi:hypothetical protein